MERSEYVLENILEYEEHIIKEAQRVTKMYSILYSGMESMNIDRGEPNLFQLSTPYTQVQYQG